jgi:hypothetical protein
MLIRLAERKDIRLCAWMLDHGYQSPAAIANAQNVCRRLNVPLVIDQPDRSAMNALFKLGLDITLDDNSDVVRGAMTYGCGCWPCLATLAARASRFAAEHRIPLSFIGSTPGQNRLDLHGGHVLSPTRLPKVMDLVDRFTASLVALAERRGTHAGDLMTPGADRDTILIPFYEFAGKPEPEHRKSILEAHGWHAPDDTGPCSSNCLMNELGREVMRSRFGFDLYQVIDANERRLWPGADDSEAPAAPPTDHAAACRAAARLGFDIRTALMAPGPSSDRGDPHGCG